MEVYLRIGLYLLKKGELDRFQILYQNIKKHH